MRNYHHIIIIAILITSCVNKHSDSTKLDSDDYDIKEDRIEKLTKEINSYSKLKDAEFELFNVNGFNNSRTSIPGASSWDYKIAVKVDPVDITKWTDGMVKTEFIDYDESWTKEITKQRSQNWITYSKPKYFTRKDGNVGMLVFQQEGIIFKRMINL